MKSSQNRFAPLPTFILVGALSVLAPQTLLASTPNAHAAKKNSDPHAAAAAQADLKPIKRSAQPVVSATSKVTTPEEELEQAKKAVANAHGDETDHAEVEVPVVTQPKVVSGPAPGTSDHAKADDDHDDHAPAPKKEPANVPQATASSSTAAAHDSSSTAASTGVTADQSLRWLTNGNTRFIKKQFRADGRTQADRDRLMKGQHPHAIVLSCADSRVAPEIVFDQALGEIFTIRVAGEALDSSVVASIEYAVEHLGPKLIVVMGHTKCGAVDAAIKVKEGDSAGSESLDKLLAEIRPHLKTVSTEKPSPNLEVESTVNADGVARDLLQRSELIRKKVEAGELKIKPALYRMDSGKVTFY